MRHLVALAACAVVVAWLTLCARDARACGIMTRPLSESQLADKLPYLAIERVLLVWDERTQTEDFVREARFEKADEAFGFVVPVPSRPEVFKVDHAPFDDLARAFPYVPQAPMTMGWNLEHGLGGGVARPAVAVLSEQRIGSFAVFILSATDGGGLKAWLQNNGFVAPPGSEEWLEHYVRLGFYYVAFRYDAPSGAAPGMTSETVRIRFKAPLPYYPYLEPARTGPSRGPRNLSLWFVSQNEATPVVAHRGRSGEVAWRKPWEGGDGRRATAKEIRSAIPLLEALVPGDEGAGWSVIAFRDAKTTRKGYGDVLLAPSAPVAADDAVIAARWPLLPILDPRLEGDLDPLPIRAETLEPPSAPRSGAETLEPPPEPKSGAVPPMAPSTRPEHGCAVAPSSPGGVDPSTGGGAAGFSIAAALVILARRMARGASSLVLLAALCSWLCSCQSSRPPAPLGATQEPAAAAFLPGSSVVTFTADGSNLLVSAGRILRTVDPASGAVRGTMDVVAAADADAGAGGEIVGLFSLDAHRVLVHWLVRDDHGSGKAMLSLVDLTAQRCAWTELVASAGDSGVAVSDDGARALVFGGGKIGVRDLAANRLVFEWDGQRSGPSAFAGPGSALITGYGKIQAVDLATGSVQRSFPIPEESQSAIAVTPDGNRAVTLSMYGSFALRVWDVPHGREARSFDVYGLGTPLDVVLSRDGRCAYTDHGSRVCAWDLDAATRVECTEPFAYVWPRARLGLSPDGRILAYSTTEGVRLWKVPMRSDQGSRGRATRARSTSPWPASPGVASGAPVLLTPSTEGSRADREASTLAVLLGHANAARMPTFAQEAWRDSHNLKVRADGVSVDGKLPLAVIDRIVRQNVGRFRLCYQRALQVNDTLSGKANITFVIDHDGSVSKASDDGSSFPDAGALACIARGFLNLSFPPPVAGEVKVTYPLELELDD